MEPTRDLRKEMEEYAQSKKASVEESFQRKEKEIETELCQLVRKDIEAELKEKLRAEVEREFKDDLEAAITALEWTDKDFDALEAELRLVAEYLHFKKDTAMSQALYAIIQRLGNLGDSLSRRAGDFKTLTTKEKKDE